MSLEILRSVLGWCLVINFGILLLWFLFFWLAHDFMYKTHSRLFGVSEEKFDEVQFRTLMQFRVLIIVFNLAPWLALHILT